MFCFVCLALFNRSVISTTFFKSQSSAEIKKSVSGDTTANMHSDPQSDIQLLSSSRGQVAYSGYSSSNNNNNNSSNNNENSNNNIALKSSNASKYSSYSNPLESAMEVKATLSSYNNNTDSDSSIWLR